MRIPSLSALLLVGLLLVGAFWVGQHRAPDAPRSYQSPCIVSWDENDGDSTFCIMTREAARHEKREASFER